MPLSYDEIYCWKYTRMPRLRPRATDTHDQKAEQGEPQTAMEPAYNQRIWQTPLLRGQAGKVFVSGGGCLPHVTRFGEYQLPY